MKFFKISGVIVGALVITTLGIAASDSLRGDSGSMLAGLIGSEAATCPAGMVLVPTALTYTCVDVYEATPSDTCPQRETYNPEDTAKNITAADCLSDSKPAALPWRYVTREQAGRLCARSGKRLPTAAEWYGFAIDTKAGDCQVAGGVVGKTGANPSCLSATKVADAVGNVWEWVSDDVIDGNFTGRQLPASGYVNQVDQAGVATVTNADTADELYDGSYFWSQASGAYGMIRGGFYGSRGDAGVYTVHAHTPPNFTGDAVGFRCVR